MLCIFPPDLEPKPFQPPASIALFLSEHHSGVALFLPEHHSGVALYPVQDHGGDQRRILPKE